ncbi:MAG: SDR family oxidoreductase [Chlorobiales bacterium]|nr:SDR family oxidoreductase [Chlorobiales bacterium]
MSEFKGKNILITGSASGIGRMMAEQFASEGAHVILWDVNSTALNAFSNELRSKGYKASAYICNLTDRNAIYATAESVLKEFCYIDILINNAGIVSGKPLLDISDEEIERTFHVNTLALFWTTRAFMPKMVERNSGHIVTISSAGGLVGTSRLTDYGSSKFAAFGFDDSLRLEIKRLGLNINTTVVCPYYIDTGMFEGVKTRFPMLLPILKPEDVVKRTVKAVRKKKARLIMPWFVYSVFPTRLLPPHIGDAVLEFFGINKTMDEFKGRAKD